jgi:hypothetical protein
MRWPLPGPVRIVVQKESQPSSSTFAAGAASHHSSTVTRVSQPLTPA